MWLARMEGGYDFADSYFRNPYLNWEKSEEEGEIEDERRASDMTIGEVYSLWDKKGGDIRDRTSWRTNRSVHIPSDSELRMRGLSDVSRFLEIAKAVFKSNPMEYLRTHAGEIVAKYHLYKAVREKHASL